MKQEDLDKVNAYLAKWIGANACINTYKYDCDRLVIGLIRPDNPLDLVGISFLYCEYIAGPTRWTNSNLQCELFKFKDNQIGVELKDSVNNFLLRCAGPIVVGDGEIIVPEE